MLATSPKGTAVVRLGIYQALPRLARAEASVSWYSQLKRRFSRALRILAAQGEPSVPQGAHRFPTVRKARGAWHRAVIARGEGEGACPAQLGCAPAGASAIIPTWPTRRPRLERAQVPGGPAHGRGLRGIPVARLASRFSKSGPLIHWFYAHLRDFPFPTPESFATIYRCGCKAAV